jgi:urease gamma subunit
MEIAAKRGGSVAERTRPRWTEALPYGLRELAPLGSPRVFCGELTLAGEQFRIQSAEHAYVLDVCSSFVMDRRLHEQRVSILGYLSEQTLAAEAPGESIIAIKIVSHEAVARRAYEIHESCRDGCAVENWLRAQRELLEQ